MTDLAVLTKQVCACRSCPRMVEHREHIARLKRRAYRDESYWGRPVPGFGDPAARIVLLGLAPGAHGSNRTGRMFTGDASGDFLYAALFEVGMASSPVSRQADDGLRLADVWITAAARCVPPGNKPTREELDSCRPWLSRELSLLRSAKVIVALGSIAHDSYLQLLRERGASLAKRKYPFAHGAEHDLSSEGGLPLLDSYHPSFQNTNTGRLTEEMLVSVLQRAGRLART